MKILLSAISVILFHATVVVAQAPIVLMGATLLDGTGSPPLFNSAVLIEGSRIKVVGTKEYAYVKGETITKIRTAKGLVDIPADAGVYDISGKFLMPGLIDAHIHYDGTKRDLLQMLAWGVTSVNCMVEATDRALDLERQTSPDSIASPQFYTTAPIFTAKNGWWWGANYPEDPTLNRYPSTPDEARAQVRKAKHKGIRRIKLMYDDMRWCRDSLPPLARMKKNVMLALLDEAGRQGLVAEIHAPEMKNAMEILAAGHKKKTTTTHSDTLVHIGSFGFAHGIVDDSISPQFARTMISKGTFYIPTFCVFEFLANTPRFIQHALSDFRLRPSLPESLSFRYVSPQYYDHYRNLFPNSAFVDSHLAMLRRNVAFLVANKVPIVLGTDMWAFPGYGVHLELEYMVKAGMTPMQAILSATKMGARFLGRDSTIGTIEPGKQADLAILVSDPLQDILSSRSVWKILKQGTMYDHEELIEESKK